MSLAEYTEDELLKALYGRSTQKTWRLEEYKPYRFQESFHDAGAEASQRLLMAANRVGKTFTGAAEAAMHLTGLYPEWWTGRRFDHPVLLWACGSTTETTRDIVQAELLGEPNDPSAEGTGAVPKHTILNSERKPGVPNAKGSALIKHISGGNSQLVFKSYEMGHEKFMGKSVDYIWLDETPPQDIYTQCLARTVATKGSLCMTFTPEGGLTDMVRQYLNDLKPGQALIRATWDDAPHLDENTKKQILDALPPHERAMRSQGVPMFGTGLVFPVNPADITCEPFPIPEYWPKVIGMDLGWEHPTCAIWSAFDADEDVIYIFQEYGESKRTPEEHSRYIKAMPHSNIPIVIPHDGNRRTGLGNPAIRDQLSEAGLTLELEPFRNPIALGEKPYGKGAASVEAGIMFMLERMRDGRLKIFSSCTKLMEQLAVYHRDPRGTGKIVERFDDYVDAARYSVLSVQERGRANRADARWNWEKKLTYPQLGLV